MQTWAPHAQLHLHSYMAHLHFHTNCIDDSFDCYRVWSPQELAFEPMLCISSHMSSGGGGIGESLMVFAIAAAEEDAE
eukprot:12205899-Alexandrium_andersonii.AAC.1